MKTYRMNIGGQEVNLCAKTMNISRKRSIAYLKNLLKKTQDDYGSHRFFWADIITLNMLTNRILYHAVSIYFFIIFIVFRVQKKPP